MIPKAFYFLVSLLFVSGIKAFTQETYILAGFTGVPQASQVQLRWIISAGETCNGTLIERSTDTIHWQSIGEIPGVCGSSSAPLPYNYIDDSPVRNTINFYRLELGGQGYSKIIGVPYYDYTSTGYVLMPNPVTDRALLYFGNSANEAFTISFFTLTGQKLMQHTGSGGSYTVEAKSFASGTYLFVISRQGKKNVSGKIIIR